MSQSILKSKANAFYHFKRCEGKSTKFVCIKSRGIYEPIEQQTNKKGEIVCYIVDANYISAKLKRKAKWKMKFKKHFSSLYPLDEQSKVNNKAYGDSKGTNDLILIEVKENMDYFTEFSIYIFKNKKNDTTLMSLFLEES